MEYFELIQDKKVEHPIQLVNLNATAYPYQMKETEFDALEELKVAYYSGNEAEEICGMLTEPTLLLADQIKRLFHLYENSIRFKAVQLFPKDAVQGTSLLYWVPCFQEIDSLHPSTKKYANGMIEELVLAGDKLEGQTIFRVSGLQEYKVCISLPVAESLLRRRIYGVGLQKIKLI